MNKTQTRIEHLLRLAEDQKGKPEGILAAKIARKLQREVREERNTQAPRQAPRPKQAPKTRRKQNPSGRKISKEPKTREPQRPPSQQKKHHHWHDCEGLVVEKVQVASNHLWRRYLLAGLAANSCCFVDKVKGAESGEYRVFGHREDVELVCTLYGEVEERVLDLWDDYIEPDGQSRSKIRNKYLTSLVLGLIDRWQEEKAQERRALWETQWIEGRRLCAEAFFTSYDPSRGSGKKRSVVIENADAYADSENIDPGEFL